MKQVLKQTRNLTLALSLFAIAGTSNRLFAGPLVRQSDDAITSTSTSSWSPFARGTMELEMTAGAFGGLNTSGTLIEPDTTYALGSTRVGWMLHDPWGSGILRGNFEFLVGVYAGWIFEGPGDYLVGTDINFRYNFVQPNARFVPFIQIGAGGAYSDAASDDEVQKLIGADWSWELQAAVGFRHFLTERIALTMMVQYQHFSNADREPRNHGLDALGGLVGVSWFF